MSAVKPTTPPRYQRLTRAKSSTGVGTREQLWLGPDHLLIVTSTGLNESYRRLYYRDIQGFYLQPTKRQILWAWFLGIVGILFSLYILLLSSSGMVFFIVLGVFVILSVCNLLMGPGCDVYVITAVQISGLSLLRRGKSRKVLARLWPLITAAQADLVAGPPPIPATGGAGGAEPVAGPVAANGSPGASGAPTEPPPAATAEPPLP